MKKLITKLPYVQLLLLLFTVSNCATARTEGKIGKRMESRYVILDEFVTHEDVIKYSQEYDASIIGVLSHSKTASATTRTLIALIGPSSVMKHLMNEFRSISNTSKHWEFIIPKKSQRYFLLTIKNIENNAVVNAKGQFLMIDSPVNNEIIK